MANRIRSYSIEGDERELEVSSFPFQLPLHALYSSKDIYANYPAFQREKVWPDKYKYALIKSLVRGAYVPDIIVTSRENRAKWVLDGQQRMRTMLEFTEALYADLNGKSIPDDENGKPYFYFRLSEMQQARLLGRMIRFTEVQNASEQAQTDMFLDLQNIVPLSTAEKLWASPSKVRYAAETLYDHEFFTKVYSGKTHHRKKFQMSVYPTLIEMFQPFADLTSDRLQALTKGKRDDLVYDGIEARLNKNMSYATSLFSGIEAASMSEIIIMYQAIWLLRYIGADLDATPDGALVDWYRTVEAQNDEWRAKGFMNLFARMTQYKVQKKVWQDWLDQIVYSGNVVFPDKNASFAQLQRVTGWLRRNGVCPRCGNAHVQLRDIGKHVFRPADAHTPGMATCNVNGVISINANTDPLREFVAV